VYTRGDVLKCEFCGSWTEGGEREGGRGVLRGGLSCHRIQFYFVGKERIESVRDVAEGFR
jgi:hypothetical protein